jgi:transcriptional regulator with XRE-family HTH domain
MEHQRHAERGYRSLAQRFRRDEDRLLARAFTQLGEEVAVAARPLLEAGAGLRRLTAWLDGEGHQEAGPDGSCRPPRGEGPEEHDLVHMRGGPQVMRVILGVRLRRIRESRGITAHAAGRAIRMSATRLSRVEQGSARIKESDLARLLGVYGVTEQREREFLLYIAGRSAARRWWSSYSAVVPDWFEPYVGLEEGASLIRTYQTQHVPELLQTEDYARAVAEMSLPGSQVTDVELSVQMVKARQAPLWAGYPLRLWVILDEAALIRTVGGTEVMRDQLQHLIRVTSLRNITIQIIPLGNGLSARLPGGFTILRYPDPDIPDVVYLEQLFGAQYLRDGRERELYHMAMDQLSVRAAPSRDTAGILRARLSCPDPGFASAAPGDWRAGPHALTHKDTTQDFTYSPSARTTQGAAAM